MPTPKKAIRTTKIKKTGLYSIMYAELPGCWISTGQDTEAAALRYAVRTKGEHLSHRRITFEEAAKGFFNDSGAWITRRRGHYGEPSAEYLPQMRGRLSVHLLPKWGDFPLDEITTRAFDDWILSMKGRKGRILKASTKNKIIDCAFLMFKEFVESGMVPSNPIEGVGYITSDETPRGIFDPEELGKLFPVDHGKLMQIWANEGKQFREFAQMWVAYFLTLRDTGARPGEIHSLHWGEWMPDHCGFPIRHSVENTTGKIKQGTKTGSMKPALLSPRGVQELLLWCSVSEHTDPGDLVFSFDGKTTMRTESVRKHFRSSMARAGVAAQGRTPYCFRHTFTTYLLEVAPLSMVQNLLGHSKKSMTALMSYFHPSDETIMRMGSGAPEILALMPGRN